VPLLPESVTQTLIQHYLPWYYNRCAEIICPSNVAENALRELGVTRPIEVIPTGIPRPPRETVNAEARRAARACIGVPNHAPMLLYVGRLAKEKNVEWLLEVFATIRERQSQARLVLAGGGPQDEELRAQAQSLGISDATLFLGPQPRRQMDGLYAAADVFCFPSPTETQGLVVGEARAAGTPCVVVDAGGAPETVCDGEDGFRVPCGDRTMFADRVLSILQDRSLARQMRVNARRNALQFTPERMIRRVLAVYARARLQPMADFDQDTQPLADEMDLETVAEGLTDTQ
jgi:glycosyltransferase involved in cell wall biosynthesis